MRAKLAFGAANTASDTQLEQLIETSSRWIEKYCGRRFYGAPETRYYTADDDFEIVVDDLTSVSVLKTDDNADGVFETTWPSTSYLLKYGDNYNAAEDGKPYTQIEAALNGNRAFPTAVRRGVLVAGTFGYASGTTAADACPDPIHDAALLLAERLYKRKDAPLGVAGAAPLGQQPVRITSMSADPDLRDLLAPYRRLV